ncbi:uncharacterized protein LOC127257411 isoform X2 [Andrographis paniculata]|uniref:uncharacterized protein LOC127257411 isoform X2 n=1 Tax=Andrographis paniculata TaxID=175694 RepID=UPI0021E95F4B|nr:uncharacterized protein LOC127257411 isoform X2 [Andrographis paniculata]
MNLVVAGRRPSPAVGLACFAFLALLRPLEVIRVLFFHLPSYESVCCLLLATLEFMLATNLLEYLLIIDHRKLYISSASFTRSFSMVLLAFAQSEPIDPNYQPV